MNSYYSNGTLINPTTTMNPTSALTTLASLVETTTPDPPMTTMPGDENSTMMFRGNMTEDDDSSMFDNGTDFTTTVMPDDDGEEDEEPDYDLCYLHTYDDNWKMARGIGEIALCVWSLFYLLTAGREILFLGARLFLKTLSLCPSRVMFLIACFLCLAAIPFRLTCSPVIEDRLALLVMLLTGPYFLFFCRCPKLLLLLSQFRIRIKRLAIVFPSSCTFFQRLQDNGSVCEHDLSHDGRGFAPICHNLFYLRHGILPRYVRRRFGEFHMKTLHRLTT